ncbi:cytochrome oxidase assembly protein-domain-containing protein [Geranomyces variabilis]|nr:cytochrome oxidase assembly protein-domain-containing protein [Geranomyces variabilis]
MLPVMRLGVLPGLLRRAASYPASRPACARHASAAFSLQALPRPGRLETTCLRQSTAIKSSFNILKNLSACTSSVRHHVSSTPVAIPPTLSTAPPQRPTEESFSSDSSSDSEPPSKPIVGWWYLFSGSLVFGIVALGGLTRLTESGLSIVEWNVIKGMKPPRSQEEWEEEFEKYKQFPEYKLLNHNITLAEFKSIFYMEWAHRMVGRFIGLSFVLPGAYFAYKGYMTKAIRNRSVLVAGLIGFQGLLGWLMVKSGLSDELMDKAHAVPRVSHYWLSAHLGSAFAIYSIMLVTGLDILRANRTRAVATIKAALSSADVVKFSRYAKGVTGIVFLTAMTGAFVAGLDAGLIYNEFPYMGDGIVPSDMWALSTPSARNPNPQPWWKDLMENPSAVQFNHRLMAMTTASAVTGLWIYSRRVKLPPNARLAVNCLLGMVGVQVALGISTLLYFVPTPLAAAHQSGSLTLLSISLWLVHALRYVKR